MPSEKLRGQLDTTSKVEMRARNKHVVGSKVFSRLCTTKAHAATEALHAGWLWQRPFTRKKSSVKTRSSCYHKKHCKKKNVESCQAEATISSHGVCNNNRVHPFTQWDFLSGVGPLWFSIGCFAYSTNKFLSTCDSACLEEVLKFGEESISVHWKTHFWHLLACQNEIGNEPIQNVFIQTSTLLPSMQSKITKHGRCCMQNNQLLTILS